MIGTTLGAYKVLDKIGSGGFAQVYLARDTRTNQVVALKVLRSEYTEDAEFVSRFRREAEALLQLPPDPHIVALHEFGEQAGTCFIAMEYLEGHDLQEVIRSHGELPIETAVSITAQVAEALAVAVRGGVIHRDVKPANVKINPQGVAKIMDFGIARAAEGTKLTRTGLFVGTPSYMAPELWEGHPAGPQSDVYALGVMLYEMLLGRAPFDATTPAATMRRHLLEPPPRLTSARPDVPQWLAEVAERALAKDPALRYRDASDLLAALRVHGQVQARVNVETLVTAAVPPMARMVARPPVSPTLVRPGSDAGLKIALALAGVMGAVFIVLIALAVLGRRGAPTVVSPTQTSPAYTVTPASLLPTATARPTVVLLTPSATWFQVPTASPSPTLKPEPALVPSLTRSAPTTRPAASSSTPVPSTAVGPRTVTLVYPPNDDVVKSSVITFKWSSGALQPGETFLVEVIPNTVFDKEGACVGDYDERVGLQFSPPLTLHEWTTDINVSQPGRWLPCPGQIDWQVHIRNAANRVIQSTHQGYFRWNPL